MSFSARGSRACTECHANAVSSHRFVPAVLRSQRTPNSLSTKLRSSSSRTTAASVVTLATQRWKEALTRRSSSSSVAAELWTSGSAGMIDWGLLAAIASANLANSE